MENFWIFVKNDFAILLINFCKVLFQNMFLNVFRIKKVLLLLKLLV